MTDFAKLADSLEALIQADRTLDQDIHQVVVLKQPLDTTIYPYAKRYTFCIDDALTLLPKGSMWSVCNMEDGPFAQVIRPMPCGGYINGLTTAKGCTPATALCIAALRGLALTGNDGKGGAV